MGTVIDALRALLKCFPENGIAPIDASKLWCAVAEYDALQSQLAEAQQRIVELASACSGLVDVTNRLRKRITKLKAMAVFACNERCELSFGDEHYCAKECPLYPIMKASPQ